MSNKDARDNKLSHIDGKGRARMVDVGGKPVTRRFARAQARIGMAPGTSPRKPHLT